MEAELVPDVFQTKVVDWPAVMTVGVASKVVIEGTSARQLGPTASIRDNSSKGRNFFIVSSPRFHSLIIVRMKI